MSLARVVGTPAQAIPSGLQRADASFELAPDIAMMIAGMYTAILNNMVHLVQFGSSLERVLGKQVRFRLRPTSDKAYFVSKCLVGVIAVGALGEIANVSQVFHPGAWLAARTRHMPSRPKSP